MNKKKTKTTIITMFFGNFHDLDLLLRFDSGQYVWTAYNKYSRTKYKQYTHRTSSWNYRTLRVEHRMDGLQCNNCAYTWYVQRSSLLRRRETTWRNLVSTKEMWDDKRGSGDTHNGKKPICFGSVFFVFCF